MGGFAWDSLLGGYTPVVFLREDKWFGMNEIREVGKQVGGTC
jgi:hypothetical protein